MSLIGLHVPVKEISSTQRALGEYLLALPKFKCVRAIDGKDSKKCVLFKADGKEVIEKYASENGLNISEEKVTLSYDNFNMSKEISLMIDR